MQAGFSSSHLTCRALKEILSKRGRSDHINRGETNLHVKQPERTLGLLARWRVVVTEVAMGFEVFFESSIWLKGYVVGRVLADQSS